jgi:thioredoxin-dependent peroxiredoxin
MIEEGSQAPAFEAQTDDGRTVSLDELRGKPVVLYFYPKDDTPGCTTQACGIRDAYSEFRARGAEVFGISVDDAEAHQAFREKFDLPFPLLVDSDRALGNAFGIEDIGPDVPIYKRSTVVIGPDGKVVRALPDVDPATHADEVLAAL